MVRFKVWSIEPSRAELEPSLSLRALAVKERQSGASSSGRERGLVPGAAIWRPRAEARAGYRHLAARPGSSWRVPPPPAHRCGYWPSMPGAGQTVLRLVRARVTAGRRQLQLNTNNNCITRRRVCQSMRQSLIGKMREQLPTQ